MDAGLIALMNLGTGVVELLKQLRQKPKEIDEKLIADLLTDASLRICALQLAAVALFAGATKRQRDVYRLLLDTWREGLSKNPAFSSPEAMARVDQLIAEARELAKEHALPQPPQLPAPPQPD